MAVVILLIHIDTKGYTEKPKEHISIIKPRLQSKANIKDLAPVILNTGTVLDGGAEQVLLPMNWPKSWIVGYREVTSKPLMGYPEFCSEPPKDNRDKNNNNKRGG